MKASARPTAAPFSPPTFFSAEVSRARRFYLDLKPSGREPLVVVCGGLEHCRTDYAIQRNDFPFYSIEYVLRGRGEVKLKARTHSLQPGRLFSYGPGVPHRITLGDKGLQEGVVEYQHRRDSAATRVAVGEVLALLKEKLGV